MEKKSSKSFEIEKKIYNGDEVLLWKLMWFSIDTIKISLISLSMHRELKQDKILKAFLLPTHTNILQKPELQLFVLHREV